MRTRLGTGRARLSTVRARLGTVRTKLGKVRARQMVLDPEKEKFKILYWENLRFF